MVATGIRPRSVARGGPGSPAVVRGGTHPAMVLAAAALAVLLSATVLAALASLADRSVEGGIRQRLAADPGTTVTVMGHYRSPAGPTSTDTAVRAALGRTFGGLAAAEPDRPAEGPHRGLHQQRPGDLRLPRRRAHHGGPARRLRPPRQTLVAEGKPSGGLVGRQRGDVAVADQPDQSGIGVGLGADGLVQRRQCGDGWATADRIGTSSLPALVLAVAGCGATAGSDWPLLPGRPAERGLRRPGIPAARCRARGTGRGR